MPNSIKTFCIRGCKGKGVEGTRLCRECYDEMIKRREQRKKEIEAIRVAHEGTASQRGYDGQWAKVSRMIRRQEPICRMCRSALSEMVDHIIPLKQGGERLNADNLQPLCRRCHAKKTLDDQDRYA